MNLNIVRNGFKGTRNIMELSCMKCVEKSRSAELVDELAGPIKWLSWKNLSTEGAGKLVVCLYLLFFFKEYRRKLHN